MKVSTECCPFCAAPVRLAAAALLAAALAACNPTAEVYGGPPPRPPADAGTPSVTAPDAAVPASPPDAPPPNPRGAAVYGGPRMKP